MTKEYINEIKRRKKTSYEESIDQFKVLFEDVIVNIIGSLEEDTRKKIRLPNESPVREISLAPDISELTDSPVIKIDNEIANPNNFPSSVLLSDIPHIIQYLIDAFENKGIPSDGFEEQARMFESKLQSILEDIHEDGAQYLLYLVVSGNIKFVELALEAEEPFIHHPESSPEYIIANAGLINVYDVKEEDTFIVRDEKTELGIVFGKDESTSEFFMHSVDGRTLNKGGDQSLIAERTTDLPARQLFQSTGSRGRSSFGVSNALSRHISNTPNTDGYKITSEKKRDMMGYDRDYMERFHKRFKKSNRVRLQGDLKLCKVSDMDIDYNDVISIVQKLRFAIGTTSINNKNLQSNMEIDFQASPLEITDVRLRPSISQEEFEQDSGINVQVEGENFAGKVEELTKNKLNHAIDISEINHNDEVKQKLFYPIDNHLVIFESAIESPFSSDTDEPVSVIIPEEGKMYAVHDEHGTDEFELSPGLYRIGLLHRGFITFDKYLY